MRYHSIYIPFASGDVHVWLASEENENAQYVAEKFTELLNDDLGYAGIVHMSQEEPEVSNWQINNPNISKGRTITGRFK